MLSALLAAGLALGSAPYLSIDTTFAVSPDARIEVENFRGSVQVRTWERDAVRIAAEHSDDDRIRIRRSGAWVRIESSGRYGPARDVDYVITVPATAALRITGPFSDVSVDGAGSDVVVESVRGDIHVRGGDGVVELRSVEGAVSLEGARGRITLAAVNETIRAVDLAGAVHAETVNGDVVLERIDSGDVVASTVNGDVRYGGTILDDGRYALKTHNGDVSIGIPEGANATISIATYNGEVDSALPIILTELRRDRRFSFAVGRGTARVDLESFNGTIRLRRPAGR
ncbi:MAG TPA: DUF4097 family beta strand repeat-containing protein [Longimicrobiales bacterium]